LHAIFAKIETKNDIKNSVRQYYEQGVLTKDQAAFIEKSVFNVVTHKDLASYYSSSTKTLNEREILTEDHQVIIPDRLVFTSSDTVVIIDYKTGLPSKEHHQQLLKYERALNTIGYRVDKKLLVYINNEIDVVAV